MITAFMLPSGRWLVPKRAVNYKGLIGDGFVEVDATDKDALEWAAWFSSAGQKPPLYASHRATANAQAPRGFDWEEFDPPTANDELRDEHGKWTSGGDSTSAAAKSKFIGQTVGAAEHARAAGVAALLAKELGGKTERETADPGQKDKKPYDVQVPIGRVGKCPCNDIEVKSLLKGTKQEISVHEDALLRKVNHAQANPSNVFHTVVVDERNTYEGGAHAENYSGHRLYYKRGNGRYTLANMQPVKDAAELKKLLNTPDEKLPSKARGSLPTGAAELAKLRESAAKASESRKIRDKARKAKNKEKLSEQARALRAAKAKAVREE